MPKRILMIAFHFPPLRGSSGIHRTLNFSRYLAEDHGWEPTVLTVHPRAYRETGDDLLGDIAPGVRVVRAFGLDTSRHLAFRGSYPLRLALPDPWMTWWFGAVLSGRRLIRKLRPDVLWSTYPIATAHRIGFTLHRKSRIPWVADFRDSMTEENYPRQERKRLAHLETEQRTVRACTRAVFTTPGTLRMYSRRYQELPRERWAVIANGYDEETFASAPPASAKRDGDGPVTLVHSGLLYRSERDPRAFFAAIGTLARAGEVSPETLRVVLRASGDEEYHHRHIEEQGIGGIVHLEGSIPYRAALAEMMAADGLLLFQASNCNHQIPAKAYEYMRARRPILALTDPAGDTADLLRSVGTGTIVRLDSEDEIAEGLRHFLAEVRAARAPIATDAEIAQHSRRARTAELATLLDAVLSG